MKYTVAEVLLCRCIINGKTMMIDPWGVLPYLAMVGRFCIVITPHFWDFQSKCVPILCLNSIWLTPSFWRKNWFVFSHLIPEILGPKRGLIFHQNVLFKGLPEAYAVNHVVQIMWLAFPLFMRTLKYNGAKLWNALAISVRGKPSLNSFKCAYLKKIFLLIDNF